MTRHTTTEESAMSIMQRCPRRSAVVVPAVHRLRAVALALLVAAPLGAAAALLPARPAEAGPTPGFFEGFAPEDTTAGFLSGATLSNPGTGGVDGNGDGFLRISRDPPFAGHLGAFNPGPDYIGDYLAAGVTRIAFWLNDVETDEALEIHLGIGYSGNFWQYNTGFAPPENSWAEFEVDLTDSTNFTQIIAFGGGNYTQALRAVDRVLWRHDLAPYMQVPDNIIGQVGLDSIRLIGTTNAVADRESPGARPRIQLLQARPNPAPAGTAIGAGLSEPFARVRLAVVSPAGRLVREIYAGPLGAGTHFFPWDGRDGTGTEVGAGVYFVTLTAGERAEVGRVVLVR